MKPIKLHVLGFRSIFKTRPILMFQRGSPLFFRFFTRREWVMTATAIVFIIAQIWMDVRIPLYMSDITDAFLIDDTDKVMLYGREMILCAFASLAVGLVAGFLMANIAASVGRNMRQKEFDSVQAMSLEDVDRFSPASLITRSTNDLTQIQNLIARGLQIIVRCPILTIWALAMMSASSWQWTLVTAVGAFILVTVMMMSLHFSRKHFERIQWLTDSVNRATKENIDGIRVIRAYNAERYQEDRFSSASGELKDNNLRAVLIMAPSYPLAQSMMNFVTLAIYWVGAGIVAAAGSVDDQLLLFSDMIVFTSYSTMVLSSFIYIFGILRMLPRTMVGVRRVEEVVDTVPSVADGTETEAPERGTVEFRNVSFSYPGSDRTAVEGISFRVEKGRTLAIIGSTGSGKTSLVNLIPRFYDAGSGQVLVDGRDVREYSLVSLRSRLGFVSQGAIIFSGPVDMNVNYGLGSEDRGDADIERALRIAHADGFVGNMPEGRGSHISQHGKNLSGGQKQRISIARALCRDPEILILDDSFSALDFKTDLELRNSLRSEMGDTTVIMVAQRVGTIRDADEIIMLDGGRIVGHGTHEQLLNDCPEYLELARSQMVKEAL